MSERHIVRTALAMRALSQRTARHASQTPQRAVILRLDPLQIELAHSALTLDDSQFTLSHSVRKYDAQYGLSVGDTLIVTPVAGGDLVATAVIAAANATSGAAKVAVAAAGQHVGGGTGPLTGATVTVGGTQYSVDGGTVTIDGQDLVGKVAFRDDEGTLVGYIPLVA